MKHTLYNIERKLDDLRFQKLTPDPGPSKMKILPRPFQNWNALKEYDDGLTDEDKEELVSKILRVLCCNFQKLIKFQNAL